MSGFYVYAHLDQNGSIRYIGKGQKKRAWSFLQRNHLWNRVFSKGNYPTVEILQDGLTEDEAFEAEIFYIAESINEGCSLVNFASGGYGGDTRNWDEKARLKLSESRKGAASYWYGKKRDPEMVERMKETKRLNPQPGYWKDKKRDPELIKKLVAAAHTPEAIKKSHETKIANGSYEWTEERKQQVSEKMTGYDFGPEHAAKISAAKKGIPSGRKGEKFSEEHKRNISEATMGRVYGKEVQDKRIATWKANGMTSSKAKQVRCIDTGEVFRSSKEAAESLTGGIGMKVIQQCCIGTKKRYKGLSFEHVQ